jgi:hypothetical protein
VSASPRLNPGLAWGVLLPCSVRLVQSGRRGERLYMGLLAVPAALVGWQGFARLARFDSSLVLLVGGGLLVAAVAIWLRTRTPWRGSCLPSSPRRR